MAKVVPIEISVSVTSTRPGGEHVVLVRPDDRPILQGQQAVSACGQEFTVTDVPTLNPTKPVCPLCVTRLQEERAALMSAFSDIEWRQHIAHGELTRVEKRWDRA